MLQAPLSTWTRSETLRSRQKHRAMCNSRHCIVRINEINELSVTNGKKLSRDDDGPKNMLLTSYLHHASLTRERSHKNPGIQLEIYSHERLKDCVRRTGARTTPRCVVRMICYEASDTPQNQSTCLTSRVEDRKLQGSMRCAV